MLFNSFHLRTACFTLLSLKGENTSREGYTRSSCFGSLDERVADPLTFLPLSISLRNPWDVAIQEIVDRRILEGHMWHAMLIFIEPRRKTPDAESRG